MNLIKYPTAIVLLLLTTLVTTPLAQQKRQTPAKPQPRTTVAPAPTFDTLVPADNYILYGEVRGVGQLIRSSTFNEFFEPILKLAGPPKELRKVVKWLNDNADELMTSRMLIATWPINNDVPEAIVAIEFASAEEATKFAGPLNQFLPTVVPTPLPELASDGKKKNEPAKPSYYFQQAGSLLLLTPKPLDLRKLRPAGSKPMTEETNFRAARNRLNSEQLFLFLDVKLMEKQQEERMKKSQEARQQAERAQKEQAPSVEEQKEPAEMDDPLPEKSVIVLGQASPSGEAVVNPRAVDPVGIAVSSITSSFFSVESDWPDGVGFALSFENDSFDLRALLINEPGEKSDALPFMPMLIPGPAFLPESPNIVPAGTDVLITMSLDLPQIYTTMSKPRPTAMFRNSGLPFPQEAPFAALEKKLGMNFKDDVLPLLGSEIAVRLPATGLDMFGMPLGPMPSAAEGKPKPETAPVLLISLKDKEGVRALMPKLIDAFGFKGASALAQTERKEDTEIVSFVNVFAYGFVGNFLVLSSEPAAIRQVVDSYLSRETLAGDAQFRSYTRWQPRPAQGQIYISPALMESYKVWAESPNTHIGEQTRAFLTRLSAVGQPITYSLSNEGYGPFHELHVPKNLVLMAVAGISGESNPPPMLANERKAISILYSIAGGQLHYHREKGSGSYATLDQLMAEQPGLKERIENSGYKIDFTLSGDKFEVSAVPVEYGKTGVRSFFIDQTTVLRGADRNGAPATSSDPRISQ
ncbi:MAG TPA: DUF3352 domain-containing protein [Pyrinomonadaceae bacterium]|nr:DUF3352 domain-containing protein [Pyrinomonadaceae bacterium]